MTVDEAVAALRRLDFAASEKWPLGLDLAAVMREANEAVVVISDWVEVQPDPAGASNQILSQLGMRYQGGKRKR